MKTENIYDIRLERRKPGQAREMKHSYRESIPVPGWQHYAKLSFLFQRNGVPTSQYLALQAVQEYLERGRRPGPDCCQRIPTTGHITGNQEKNRAPGNKAREKTWSDPHPFRGKILPHHHDLPDRGYFSGDVQNIPEAVCKKPCPGRVKWPIRTNMVFPVREKVQIYHEPWNKEETTQIFP